MSSRKNRFARNPLMYIQQPSVEQPKARMQHSYQSSRQAASESNKNTQKITTERALSKRVSTRKSAKTEADAKNSEEEQPSEEQITYEKKARFQDMTLEEKIEKLASSSSQLVPKMRCAVETTGRTYRGIILDYKEDTVYMRSNRMNVEIPFDDIKDARMLGL